MSETTRTGHDGPGSDPAGQGPSSPRRPSLDFAAMAARKPMKLYVWEGVFADWTPGLAVAIAPDLRSARKAVLDKYAGDHSKIFRDLAEKALKAAKPQVIKITDGMSPQGWAVAGGS